jgi:hypothetical protein
MGDPIHLTGKNDFLASMTECGAINIMEKHLDIDSISMVLMPFEQ